MSRMQVHMFCAILYQHVQAHHLVSKFTCFQGGLYNSVAQMGLRDQDLRSMATRQPGPIWKGKTESFLTWLKREKGHPHSTLFSRNPQCQVLTLVRFSDLRNRRWSVKPSSPVAHPSSANEIDSLCVELRRLHCTAVSQEARRLAIVEEPTRAWALSCGFYLEVLAGRIIPIFYDTGQNTLPPFVFALPKTWITFWQCRQNSTGKAASLAGSRLSEGAERPSSISRIVKDIRIIPVCCDHCSWNINKANILASFYEAGAEQVEKTWRVYNWCRTPDTSVMRSKLIHCCDQGFSL